MPAANERSEADVIVVGAGLSGLIAARKVLEAGLRPLVLEADERVGGRILTEEVLPGLPVELGAQWIGDTHHRMFALAAELGVETFPQYDEGETSYDLAGSGVLREKEFHARFGSELAELERVLRLLDELAAEVPVEAPWLAPRADRVGRRSPPAPGTTARGFRRSPAPCWRSARSGSSRCPPSRCPSCICCSPSRPAA